MNIISYSLLASAVLAVEPQEMSDKKCRALAFSGGGAYGAFEVGAIYGMWHAADNKQDYEYDVVTGISAGGINAFGVSMFTP